MKSRKGIFITIDGIDGAGKTTQKKLLVRKIRKLGLPIKEIKFPQYNKRSAWQIKQYLNGFFGKLDEVNPYFASLLYADDRLEAKPTIEAWLKSGVVIISDRYAAANAGHQGGKIVNPKKRKCYLNWLWETEFRVNRIPMPDINIILWVSPTIAYKLIFRKEKRGYLKKGRIRDGHERDLGHLRRAAASYKWLAKQDPRHFIIINCMKDERLLTPEEIHLKIWKKVGPVITNSKKYR